MSEDLLNLKPDEEVVILRIGDRRLGESDKRSLSPSALASYDVCGRRGQFYQDKTLPRANVSGTARGRAWHAGMEAFNWSQPDVWSIDALYKECELVLNDLMREPDFVMNPGDSTQSMTEALWIMCTTFVSGSPALRWDGNDRMGIEVRVTADLGSKHHFMPGIIDAVMRTDTHGPVGVDYKSAGRAWGGAKALGDPRKMVQPALYAEAWEQTTGMPMDWFAMDVMTLKGRFDRIWVPTSKAHRTPLIERWLETSESIVLHEGAGIPMPTNPDHILCSAKWCNYWNICPMGEAYDNILYPPQFQIVDDPADNQQHVKSSRAVREWYARISKKENDQ